MSEPLISVEDLSKSFAGPDGRAVPVLEGIDLNVAEGEFVALLGRSGSGKSTLLRCIAGLIAPSSGRVLFRGKPLTGTNRETTMVFQTFALLPWLTVQENVELGLEARGVPPAERADRALRAIDQVGLDGYESAYPKELSGGMRQRVGFARALVVEPAALLMDEPFSALDVLTSENLRGELLEIWEGGRFPTKTMVMVTHNIEEAVLLADRILVLGTNPGRIKAEIHNPLQRPRKRRTPEFDTLVDEIYRLMTQRDQASPPEPSQRNAGKLTDTPLPQATVDGLSGLAEILQGRHDGAGDVADVADGLGLDVDDMLPLIDALVLLGFAQLRRDQLSLSRDGAVFAGANIQESKEIFARACLDRAPLVRTIYSALRGSVDGNLPAGFFLDILRTSFSDDEAGRQLDTAVNWGRYAELYSYDADSQQITREDQGIGAALADSDEPAHHGALHLYLGAAPGSGKTFTMLREGRALRDRGEDVLIGYVDTRGRARTTEAIGGLEIVPPAPDGDMDTTEVLKRHPAVVLVDDFARHQAAIEELRDAGIEVFSTVDVTDLARAADVVRSITGEAPATTVPDEALAHAEDIRFVDSSPEALRARLGHGNIYPDGVPDEASERLFSAASLARLREIGLQVIAETLPGRDERNRAPHDVLVAVNVPAAADELIELGVRLARSSSAKCTVLVFGPDAPEVTANPGVTVISREGKDPAATIAGAVRETGVRHLFVAEPTAKLRDRWRPALAEHLTDQLSDVHLHVLTGHNDGVGMPRAPGSPSASDSRGRGSVRVYLGYAPGCGTTTAMLEEAGRRKSRGSDVVVATADGHGLEPVTALLDGLEEIGDGSSLDVAAILARQPDVVCIDDLAVVDDGETRLAAARQIADAGINIISTVHVASLSVDGGPGAVDEAEILAFADEIELVDAPPSVLADRIRRGDVVPEGGAEAALRGEYSPQSLEPLREQAFAMVAEHAERRLAGYEIHSGDQLQPVILACAAPRPGMEPLIRHSAALAAKLAGDFLTAVVAPRPESSLDGYRVLTEQLGGEFTVLTGAPAAALMTFAKSRHVTEMVLVPTGPAGIWCSAS